MPTDYAGCSVASLKDSLTLFALPTCSEIECNAVPHMLCALEN